MLVGRSMDRAVKICSPGSGATVFLERTYRRLASSYLSMNDYSRARGTFRLSLPLTSLDALEILAPSGPASLTGGC